MMPSVLAFLAAHWLAFFVLACMVVTTAIHQPIVRERFPRLVALVQGVLPADMPKVIAALVDRLPLMDREIAIIVEEVVERLLAARAEVASRGDVNVISPGDPIWDEMMRAGTEKDAPPELLTAKCSEATCALGTSGGAKMPPPGRG